MHTNGFTAKIGAVFGVPASIVAPFGRKSYPGKDFVNFGKRKGENTTFPKSGSNKSKRI